MEIYKNWQIRKSDYAVDYYEATNLNDCDAFMKHAKSIEELKTEIDEDEQFLLFITGYNNKKSNVIPINSQG